MPLQATSGAASYDAFGGGVAAVPQYIEDMFSTYLYTGNGSTQTITNGIDLSTFGGMVWTKARSVGQINWVFDTVRGPNSPLGTNTNGSVADNYSLYFSPDTNIIVGTTTGYSIGTPIGGLNTNTYPYVGWTFRKKTKFFDIVTFTGTGSTQTIAHNLGSVPGCIIVKDLEVAYSWQVYHRSLTSAEYSIQLNLIAAQSSQPTIWNSTAPTSTNFTVGTSPTVNGAGKTYVAYIFAHNAGGFGLTGTDNVISCGSFTADGSGNANVTLGYEPQWVLIKNTTQGEGWYLTDTMRGMPVTPATNSPYLSPNTSAAETSWGSVNGVNATGWNTTSLVPNNVYIYIAIRRGPMKVPTVGTSVYNAIARTGTGPAAATVTGVGFTPDIVINKIYATNAGTPGNFTDKLRGRAKSLTPFSYDAESTSGATNDLVSFDMNGISVGAASQTYINSNTQLIINWFFQRAPSFFDEVCYTGTNVAGLTFSHNLAAVPELMIMKVRNQLNSWQVYSATTGNGKTLYLDQTAAASSGSDIYLWNNTSPTSTQFTLGQNTVVNANGATYVAYLFATCAGVSKVGSYTGNGSTQTINCSFTTGARFVLIKRTDATSDWYVWDTVRGMTTLAAPYVVLNDTGVAVATLGAVTTVSTGFALNSSILADINVNGGTYIFLAIA